MGGGAVAPSPGSWGRGAEGRQEMEGGLSWRPKRAVMIQTAIAAHIYILRYFASLTFHTFSWKAHSQVQLLGNLVTT